MADLNFDPVFSNDDVHSATVGMGSLCHVGEEFLELISCADSKRFLAKSSIGLDVFYSRPDSGVMSPRNYSGS